MCLCSLRLCKSRTLESAVGRSTRICWTRILLPRLVDSAAQVLSTQEAHLQQVEVASCVVVLI